MRYHILWSFHSSHNTNSLTSEQIVNLDVWESFQSWFAHVRAATTLMELRGRDQFERERSGQLYIWIRAQMAGVPIECSLCTNGYAAHRLPTASHACSNSLGELCERLGE
jgi:hypothetical protein